MADGTCNQCGQPVDFRYVDGVCRPIHASGACPAADRREWAVGGSGGVSGRSQSWKYRECCVPSRCPKCRHDVFFVRHNGGAVWFDELGWPWPKHACFDGERGQTSLDWIFQRQGERDCLEPFGTIIKVVHFSDRSLSAKLLAISVSNRSGACLRVDPRSPLRCGDIVVLEEQNDNDVVLRDGKGTTHAAKVISPATLDLTPQFLKTGVISKTKSWNRSLGMYAPGRQRDESLWTECRVCGTEVTRKNMRRHMRKVHDRQE
jgi:hypothetical protein